MKKTVLQILGVLLLFPLAAASAFGLSLQDFRKEVYRPDNLPGAETGTLTAENKIVNVIDFLVNLILYASGSVAVLMLVYGGVRLITAAGSTEQKEASVKIIKYAGFGLAVVVLAYAVVTNVIDLIFRATT
jgi:hypothetical protein